MSRIVHFELPTTNPDLSQKFYETVLGWKISNWDGEGDYRLIATGDPSQPGINGALGGPANDFKGTLVSIGVGDLEATLALVEANGGKVVVPIGEIQDVGRIAYIQDPGGAVVGIFEPLPGSSM